MNARCAVPDAFARFVPTRERPWTFELAHRLHRRVGFGASYAELLRDRDDGCHAAITRVLAGRVRSAPDGFEDASRRIVQAAVASGSPDRLKAAWIHRMLHSPDPLRERLALFWHDHFATSDAKLTSLGLMWRQNQIFRTHAFSRFGTLLREVLADPALPLWLDAIGTTADRPNQNLGRELLELFTLGVGNFGENDVLEASRALTGLRIEDGRVRQDWAHHDDGLKTILGKTDRFDLDSLVALLVAHPATARRITRELLTLFLGDLFLGDAMLDAATIDALAAEFSTRQLDVGWLVEEIVRSDALFHGASRQRKVLDPAGFVIGGVRALEIVDPPADTYTLAQWISQMGLDLYFPPSVGGWEGEASWLDPRAMVIRARFAEALCDGRLRGPQPARAAVDLAAIAAKYGFGEERQALADFAVRVVLGVPWSEIASELRADLDETLRSADDGEFLRLLFARVLAAADAQVC